jgi:diguanylate cyclase (GGDEF)-like protein
MSLVHGHLRKAGQAAVEGSPAHAAEATLCSLRELTGASHGELDWRGATEHGLIFGSGPRPEQNPWIVDLRIGDHEFGSVALWDGEFGYEDLETFADRLSLSLRAAELEYAVGEQQAWRTSVASAIAQVGPPADLDTIATRIVTQARRLLHGSAGVLVSGRPPSARMWHDGLYKVSDDELHSLLPQAAPPLALGEVWSGSIADGPLARQGLAAVAAVGLGAEAGERTLIVLSADAEDFGSAETSALTDFGISIAPHLQAGGGDQSDRRALVDPSTGMPGNSYFEERLSQETARAERHLRSVSVLVMALDTASAELDKDLITLSSIAASDLRVGDVPCRVGEDEVGVILSDVETMDAVLIADRLRGKVRESDRFSSSNTLSVGAATFPARAGSAKELRKAASRALGWARGDGTDRTFVYEREIAASLEDEVAEDLERNDAIAESLRMLADAVDGRRGANGHAMRVARIARQLASRMGLPRDRAERVYVAAMLHDIGQISMSEETLGSPEELEVAAQDEVREHPDIGAQLLAGTPFNDVRLWIRHHHERADGTGYPDNLEGEHIPIEAQIIGVAEAFDELTADRPYRDAVPIDAALAELQDCAGTQFTVEVVDALRSLADDGHLDAPGGDE